MKKLISNTARLTSTVLGLLFAVLANPARAGIYYWDPNGTDPVTGGTWDTVTAQWATSSALTASTVVWDPTGLAVFAAGAADPGTITVEVDEDITTAGVYNGGESGIAGVTSLTFTGGGTLNFTGIQGFSVASGKTSYFEIPLTGDGTFIAEGAGQLYLDATNTYSGGTYLGYNGAAFTGTLSVNNGGALGLGLITVSNNTGILAAKPGGAVTITNAITFLTSTQTLSLGSGGGGNLFVLSGQISGGGSVVADASSTPGTVQLAAVNTYTGSTTITNGVLQLGADYAVPTNSAVMLQTGGTLDLNAHNDIITTLNGAGVVSNLSATLTICANAATNGSQNYNNYSCVVGTARGSGALVKSGTGAMGIRTNIGFGGSVTVNGGTLSAGAAANVLVNPDNGSAAGLTVTSGGLFQVDANSQTISSLSGSGNVNLGGGTLYITNNSSATFSGVIQNSELAGSSTAAGHGLRGYYYTNIDLTGLGAVRDDSTVNFPNMTSLPWGYTNNVSKTNQISVRWLGHVLTTVAGTYAFVATSDDGARLWVNGTLLVNNWVLEGATAMTNTIALSANTRYDLVLEYFNNGGPGVIELAWMPPGTTGPLIIPSANLFLPGPGTLVMNGSGAQQLGVVSTYTGGTLVSSGTLEALSNGALGSGNVTVATGATLKLDTTAGMGSGADLIVGGSAAVNLNYSGAQNIRALSLDGGNTWKTAGTYGHSASNPTGVFQGTGLLNVAANPTTNVLTSSPSSPATVVYGSAVTLTATIMPASATGTVTFYDGTNWLGANGVVSGVATLSVSNLLVSTSPHSLTAIYSGDATHSASPSSAVSVTTTPATLTPIIAASKTYDATANASITAPITFSGILPGDANYVYAATNGLTVAFSSKAVGTNKPVSFSGTMVLTGSLATNYVLAPGPYSVTANITNKVLTVNGLSGVNKTYDGTTNATVSGTPALQPTEPPGTGMATDGKPYLGDSYSFSTSFTGSFATKTVGTNKTVTIVGLALTGTDAANYSLSVPTVTANITSATLNITGVTANNKTYDATTTATLGGTATLSGVVSGDQVTLGTSYVASFATKNVGTGIAVTVTGYALSGGDASNYTLNQPTGLTGNITKVGTSVAVLASANPAPGVNVTMTATVAATAPILAPDAPTGTWAFYTNNVAYAPSPTVTYNSPGVGIGSITTAGWKPSGNTIYAYYPGDNNYQSSYAQTYKYSSTNVFTSSPNPSAHGASVSFTATLSAVPPATGTPTGNVIFVTNGVPLSTNALVSGVASAATAALPVGTNILSAWYAGDSNFVGVTNSLSQVVTNATSICSATNRIYSIVNNGNGTFTLNIIGTPQAQYYLLSQTNAAQHMTNWIVVPNSTNTVTNSSGLWQFTVTNRAPAFYRARAVSACQ